MAADIESVQDMETLLGIVKDALKIDVPFYVASIFGSPLSWIPPYKRFSEFRIVNLWKMRRTIKYLINTVIPSLPLAPPPFGLPVINNIFWQPTVILQRPDHHGNYTTFLDESWFFINGIMTNDSLAQMNAAYLAYLFHRPITLIQNSTDSLLVDLLECSLGKQWFYNTEAASRAFPPIYDALKDKNKKKVVVIAHSQGTIIAANVLRKLANIPILAENAETALALKQETLDHRNAPHLPIYPDQTPLRLDDFDPLTEAEFAKLELYCFANCANNMTYLKPPENGKNPIPWIESFGNENDIVARLGMLAPRPDKWGIKIDGPCYKKHDAWGHLLNQHYLFEIAKAQKDGYKKGGQNGMAPYVLVDESNWTDFESPRLFKYINGGTT